MEINFMQAEFIKQLCVQHNAGLKVLTKGNDAAEKMAAISQYLGVDVSEDKMNDVIQILKEQSLKSQEIIESINQEYGL